MHPLEKFFEVGSWENVVGLVMCLELGWGRSWSRSQVKMPKSCLRVPWCLEDQVSGVVDFCTCFGEHGGASLIAKQGNGDEGM